MVAFSGLPDLCLNFVSPACFAMSTNTTGAPSTNPPAVMGRNFSSLTAACATPVETPEVGCCCCVLPGSVDCANATQPKKKMAEKHKKAGVQKCPSNRMENLAALTWTHPLLCRWTRAHPLEESGLRQHHPAFVQCRSANGFPRSQLLCLPPIQNELVCRWKKDSFRQC